MNIRTELVQAKAEAIDWAILTRRSVRAFRPDPVERERVDHILTVAARAPSGTNMQPWRVHVLAGTVKTELCDALVAAFLAGDPAHKAEYQYYPESFFEPYLGRRRKVGWDLYGLLGIAKGDKAAMQRQHARNFRFFDAPIGLIFTIDRRLGIGSWLDYGMFLENVMIAARAHNLDTCAQAAFAPLHAVIREHLALSPDELVVCGMALGYGDPDAVENKLQTERVPPDGFATFHGF